MVLLLSIQFSYALSAVQIYEDAESNNIAKWLISDNNPEGASISNVYDPDRQSQVIELLGDGLQNSYILHNSDGSWWYNREHKIIQWSMNYAEDFRIFIRVKTTDGIRFIYYTSSENSSLEDSSGIYIHHGLGSSSKDGTWHTITRNLEEDLKEAQPDNEIIYIAGVYIRGSGKVDDIKTLANNIAVPPPPPPPENNTTIISSSTLTITSMSGDGDYKCNGTSDQIEINKALDRVSTDATLTTVYLKGEMSCVIDEPILISSNTILKGDSNVTVKLKDNIGWNTPNKPLIGQKNDDGTVAWSEGTYGSGAVSNIEISGFELSGGIQTESIGQSFIILMNFYNPSYIKIHDMNLHDSRGDIIRFYGSDEGKSNHLKVYDNLIKNSGHEGIYFIYADNVEAYNNKIYTTRTNTGIRVSSGSNFSIHNNIIGNSLTDRPSGYAGILIDSSSPIAIGSSIIHNNLIYGKNGGIVLEAGSGFDSKSTLTGVHIHHNRLYKINNYDDSTHLNGAIRINGFHNTLIEHNTIEGSKKDGIVYDEHKGTDNRGIGYETIVRNNIISNSEGYGINNLNETMHTFISENNDLFNNGVQNGNVYNYNNVDSSSDIHVNPEYANTKFKAGWHHVVATYDALTERFKIYIDGKKKADQQFIGFGNIGINSRYISIGTYRGLNVYQLKGRLDDMGVWERALTDNEVLELWNGGLGKTISNGLTTDLNAYWQMENNWNDSFGTYHSEAGWSSANFTSDAKLDSHAGLFNGGENYTLFPNTLSPSSALTISTWIYRDEESLNDNSNFQTIFNKGAQESNDHIWLYAKGDSIYFELGNGRGIRQSVSSSGIDSEVDLDLHLASEYGRWSGNGWVFDSETSLAIDQANPSSDYSNELPSNGGRANLGAYGNTAEASKSQ
jgi:hypothetical protein